MEVQNASSAWLSDFEVFQLLQENKETRNPGIKLPENILTVEFEALEYFTKFSSVAKYQSVASLTELLKFLQPIKLTKAEKLQITNLLPRTMVDFYLIVEECEERFKEDEVEAILNKINELYPQSSSSAVQDGEDVVMSANEEK